MGISTSHLREKTHSIPLRIAKGHFATNKCHVNYYVDMTYTKHRLAEAHEAAKELVQKLDKSSPIDSILCLEGTEVLGTCIAEELIQAGIRITNEHGTIYVVTPELTSSNQIIFRSNTAHLIRNRHVLILAASVATGAMVLDAVNAVKYYGGMPEGICAIFSAGQKCAGLPITAIFTLQGRCETGCAGQQLRHFQSVKAGTGIRINGTRRSALGLSDLYKKRKRTE